MNGRVGAVQLLMSRGVDINLKNGKDGLTPLWEAAMDNRIEMMKVLLENGADPNIADRTGRTPIRVASGQEAKDLLLKYGAQQ